MPKQAKKYTEPKEAVAVLERNGHVVNMIEKSIGLYMPGLKCLGAADYLKRYHKYVYSFVH